MLSQEYILCTDHEGYIFQSDRNSNREGLTMRARYIEGLLLALAAIYVNTVLGGAATVTLAVSNLVKIALFLY